MIPNKPLALSIITFPALTALLKNLLNPEACPKDASLEMSVPKPPKNSSRPVLPKGVISSGTTKWFSLNPTNLFFSVGVPATVAAYFTLSSLIGKTPALSKWTPLKLLATCAKVFIPKL